MFPYELHQHLSKECPVTRPTPHTPQPSLKPLYTSTVLCSKLSASSVIKGVICNTKAPRTSPTSRHNTTSYNAAQRYHRYNNTGPSLETISSTHPLPGSTIATT